MKYENFYKYIKSISKCEIKIKFVYYMIYLGLERCFFIVLYMYFIKNVFGVKLYNEKNKKMCIKLSQFENSLYFYLYFVFFGLEKIDLDYEGDKGFENVIFYRIKKY